MNNVDNDKVSANTAKVAVFDLDGTITYTDTYVDFLVFCLKKRPLRILRGGALVAYLCVHKLGLRSNHWLKAKYLHSITGGMSATQLQSICEEFSAIAIKKNFKPKALEELARLREQGYVLVLATASFKFYVEQLFDALEMDYLLCTDAEVDASGGLTGKLAGKNCIGEEKAIRVADLLTDKQLLKVDRAYSDHRVDMPLFEMADTALVIDPKPATETIANDRGFKILLWR